MSTPVDITDLPAPIRAYLTAHGARDTGTALRHFTATPVVVDDGVTYRGTDEVRDFLANAGSEFTYTTELRGAERVDDARWVAQQRLEGDFPGGVADLDHRFTLDGDLIAELVIAPVA
ncbi:nuclear transport factor 2 family protein [Cellulomonas sp. Sa3CUA2]|uniref:Nuclear transport factor 2 family protein n=1 Tax=Cellulomonas avistercoris TaxID=2762242 RepID=A0ABR8QFW0_9CELL|nr:nuclear transport factor 2 family protein [Cellulomonas avistercoris]MBD7919312.1 nuclear transport factor 2 family protein [Cellulomonas avistercoris]